MSLEHATVGLEARAESDLKNVTKFVRQASRSRSVDLVPASSIEARPIDWIWNGWLARGKLHLLAGAPSAGKTTIALSFASTISKGGAWPDGTLADAGDVIVWSGEDDAADTLVPRLIAAGANLARVHFVRATVKAGRAVPFDPAADMLALQERLRELEAPRLMVLDPVVSAVAGDSHKGGEVRRGLQPLVDLAAERKCAVLGITHFAKGGSGREPLERVMGSVAFGALARVVMVASRRYAGSEDQRVLMKAKANNCPVDGGFAYSIEGALLPSDVPILASSISWGETVDGTAWDAFAEADMPPLAGDGDARSFLKELLTQGPMPAADVLKAATEAGFSEDQMQRAKTRLGAKSQKGHGMGAPWKWVLPRPDD